MSQMIKTKTDQMAADVLTTAIEGGTGYWAACSKIVRADDLSVLSVRLHELNDEESDFDGTEHDMDLTKIKAATRRVAFDDTLNCAKHFAVEARSLIFDSEDADYDADTADVIVQVACFGELKYG